MVDERRRDTDGQWLARPGLARLVRTVAWLTPLTLAVVVSGVLAQRLPPAQTPAGVVGRWLVLCGVSTVVLVVVDRFARRLLPLAALLRLALIFPDRAPSRYKLARSVATTRQLEAEIEAARTFGIVGGRAQAAEQVLQLVAALSVHDRATRGHAERVRIFTDMIADEMGLAPEEIARLRWASLLHDVGKIFVSPDILNKPGAPTEEEWEVLRTHPLEGARLAAPLHEWLGSWILTIEQHHERWDGGGYPFGLSGREISLGARIVAVADAFDVMTSARSYKRPMTATAARADLARCAGSQFDPKVVRAFLALSLSRVRWAVGPVAWLLNLPMVRLVPLQSVTPASASMSHGMSGMAAVTSTAVAASGIGVVGLPAVSALDFARNAAPVAVSAAAFPDGGEVTSSLAGEVTEAPHVGVSRDPDDVAAFAEQVRAPDATTPGREYEDDDGDRSEPAADGTATSHDHRTQEADTVTTARAPSPSTSTPPSRTDHAGPGANGAPARLEGEGPGANGAPPRPEGAGPGANDAPPRPEGAGPGANDASPRPDHAGPGASPGPATPDRAGPSGGVDARPTPSPATEDAGAPSSGPPSTRPTPRTDSRTDAPSTTGGAPVPNTPGARPGAPKSPSSRTGTPPEPRG